MSELCINLNKKLIVLSDNKDSTELALKELHDINIHLSNLVEMDRGLVEFQKETFLELKESTNVNNRLDNIIESIKNLSQEVSLSNDIVRKG
ncbi:hypothetical protein AB2F28_23560 (plasmid) [Escherichia coli]